jgi:DNA helicase-2/ATP-dependent DNA helicase PcrA
VRHKLFGSGVIVEVTGAGKDVKVTIDFEDESVGRKQIKPAYTTLERGWE